jgi:hypothetical protein
MVKKGDVVIIAVDDDDDEVRTSVLQNLAMAKLCTEDLITRDVWGGRI